MFGDNQTIHAHQNLFSHTHHKVEKDGSISSFKPPASRRYGGQAKMFNRTNSNSNTSLTEQTVNFPLLKRSSTLLSEMSCDIPIKADHDRIAQQITGSESGREFGHFDLTESIITDEEAEFVKTHQPAMESSHAPLLSFEEAPQSSLGSEEVLPQLKRKRVSICEPELEPDFVCMQKSGRASLPDKENINPSLDLNCGLTLVPPPSCRGTEAREPLRDISHAHNGKVNYITIDYSPLRPERPSSDYPPCITERDDGDFSIYCDP